MQTGLQACYPGRHGRAGRQRADAGGFGATGGAVDSVADVMDAGLSDFAAYLVRVARGQVAEAKARREAREIIKESTGGDVRSQLKMLRAIQKSRCGYVELLREEILECAPLMRQMLSTYTDHLERMVVSMRTALASGSETNVDRCAARMGMDSESLARGTHSGSSCARQSTATCGRR